MNTPFILAAQPNVPSSFNREEMLKRERAFATRLGVDFSILGDTCTETDGGGCDDED